MRDRYILNRNSTGYLIIDRERGTVVAKLNITLDTADIHAMVEALNRSYKERLAVRLRSRQ